MDVIQNQLNDIIKLIEKPNDNTVALASLIIAILALAVTIIFNVITHIQYINSLRPCLSFKLFECDGLLYLNVKNTGQSEAKNIQVTLKSMMYNGECGLEPDEQFNEPFMLFPEEDLQGLVAIYGANMATGYLSPKILVNVRYVRGNDGKTEDYTRTISFYKMIDVNERQNRFIKSINDELESIMYSENRIANYLQGYNINAQDRINVISKNSLYSDLNNLLNIVKESEESNCPDVNDGKLQNNLEISKSKNEL